MNSSTHPDNESLPKVSSNQFHDPFSKRAKYSEVDPVEQPGVLILNSILRMILESLMK